jgi:twinkle protein
MPSDSQCIGKEPCPKCGSRDNLGRYDDGHAYCFGCHYYEPGDSQPKSEVKKPMTKDYRPLLGEAVAIPARGLTKETCQKFGYITTKLGSGEVVQVANYPNGQKVRSRDKTFSVRGTLGTDLFGRSLWREKGRRVIVAEGEIDAMSISQVLDHKWPVVSIPNGVAGARKALAANLDWLSSFDEVVLCFDMDDPGKEGVTACSDLFRPGQLKVISLPLKDANEMLKAKRVEDLVRCIWDANTYRPDGIVQVSDVLSKVLKAPEQGLPWCIPALTAATFGRRYGEAVALGAGTGVGKSTLMTQQIMADLQAGHKVGVFAFEQLPSETIKRIAGQMTGHTFHIPDGSWKQEDLEAAVTQPCFDGLYLYDHFGACDWDVVRERIRFLRHAHGVRLIYLDHLTALAASGGDDERIVLERIMSEVGSLVKELGIWLFFVSHLSTPEGAPHEEGGRVKIRHFKGSRAIGFWSHFMFGLERDQQGEDEDVRDKSVLRILKDRYTGRGTGLQIPLSYDTSKGVLVEEKEAVFNNDNGEPF